MNADREKTREVNTTLSSWLPPHVISAWAGAWTTHVELDRERRVAWDGEWAPPLALDIAGSLITASNGQWDAPLELEITAPCRATLVEKRYERRKWTGHTNFHELAFSVDNGTLVVGRGAVGYRRDKRALVCALDGVYVVDGTCTFWRRHFEDWERASCRFEWTADELRIWDDDRHAITVDGSGDVLTSAEFRDSVARSFHARAASFAEAKAKVRAERAKAARDPR